MSAGGSGAVLEQFIECRVGSGEAVSLNPALGAIAVLTNQSKLTQVGHEDELVLLPIVVDLIGRDQRIEVEVSTLYLDDPSVRICVLAREEPEVGLSDVRLAVVKHGANPGRKLLADGAEEIVEGSVVRQLRRSDAAHD